MATKISADVLIGGKVYTLSGYESEEYLHKVASFLNKKIDELVNGLEGYNRLPQDTKALLLQLNIADEYFKSKERVDELETDLADYKQNQADMKHELIALQIIMELETRNKELLHNKEQLEAALEKKLL